MPSPKPGGSPSMISSALSCGMMGPSTLAAELTHALHAEMGSTSRIWPCLKRGLERSVKERPDRDAPPGSRITSECLLRDNSARHRGAAAPAYHPAPWLDQWLERQHVRQ